jgi:LEA14-like dessication related protein
MGADKYIFCKSALIGVLLLFYSFFLLPACQDKLFKKPEITLQKIEISSITLKEIGVNLTADISNPNLIDVEIEKFLYKIMIEGNEMVSGELKDRVKVKSNGSATFVVSAKIDIGNPDLWNTAIKAVNGNKINYKIEGEISLNTSIGKKNINIDKTGEYMLKK